ncbi:ribonuclease H-like domain-containing protein [Tanacetum coccineum]
MTPSSPPSYTFLEPTPSPLLNTLTSAPTPPPTTHETTQPNNTTIPNAKPNTTCASTPQASTPTEPQSTLPTLIAQNHTSGPSTLAHPTSLLPPPIFDLSNPQPNTEPVYEPPRTHPMITRSQSGIIKPIDRLSLHTSSISLILKNLSHALKDPNWRNAMYDEYNALVKNGTWLLVPRPARVNMVRSMWLFKHKFHADGTLSRYKARLVANGSSQQLGVDFDEMFSPVAKPAIVRTVLSLVMSHKWPIHQLNVKNAFLNDDIILTASCPALLQQIIGSLNNEFDMTDLRALNYFLGISTDRTPTGLFLSQKKYALQLLERAHMVNCNPSRKPVDTESKLGPEVQQICLYMHDLREPHFAALKRILRYVRGTVDFDLQLYVFNTTYLVGYTDADWACCPSTRRSTSGYCVFLGDNLLSWSAKRQHTISRSSSEAEYRGVANVVAETAWVRNLLRELHSPLMTTTLVYCDNVSAVYMSANLVQHQRTKYIEIDIHFVRDIVTAC